MSSIQVAFRIPNPALRPLVPPGDADKRQKFLIMGAREVKSRVYHGLPVLWTGPQDPEPPVWKRGATHTRLESAFKSQLHHSLAS